MVQSIEQQADGPVRLTLKLDHGTRALLGTDPTAVVVPTTLLGGTYFVQLHPGGRPGEAPTDVIPVQRTGLPVELQQILAAIPPDAQHGLQGSLASLDKTFQAGAGAPLTRLMADAPSALRPTTTVVDALRGLNKDSDLANLVTDLNSTARTLAATPGRLSSLVDSLGDTAAVLGDNARPVDRTIATLPATLRTTRDGTAQLDRLLDRLTDTADDIRPIARELDPTLKDLRPALAQLRPALDELHPLLRDAEPLLRRLTPAVQKGTDVLDDVDGPVLDRIKGPILDSFLGQWKGYAPKYPQAGRPGSTMYQELAHLAANVGSALQYHNASTHQLGVFVGAGSTSVQGTGPAAQSVQDMLAEMYGLPEQGHRPVPLGPSLSRGIRPPGHDVPSPTIPAPNLSGRLPMLGGN